MDWTQMTVSTNSQGADIVSEFLMSQGAKGTQIVDRADIPDPGKPHGYWELIDVNLLESMPQDVQVKAWFPGEADLPRIARQLTELPALAGFDLGTLGVAYADVQEKDWAEHWKQYYKPFSMGDTLVVKPSWEPYAPQEGEKVMELDPGMAFGTGSHETTALCVELMDAYPCEGSFLDIGTGSGILSIAAGLLGAKEVWAVDIDPVAVEVARDNVKRNGLEDVVTVRQGDLTQGLNQVFDMAVANILADVILMLLEPLKNHLKKNGILLCSGIIEGREQDVLDGLAAAGYMVLETRRKGDWVAIAAKG